MNFLENDETKSSIWDTKEKLEDMDDEEAVQTAIDQRKYKLLKLIKWEKVEGLIDGDDDEDSLEMEDGDAEEEQEELEEYVE